MLLISSSLSLGLDSYLLSNFSYKWKWIIVIGRSAEFFSIGRILGIGEKSCQYLRRFICIFLSLLYIASFKDFNKIINIFAISFRIRCWNNELFYELLGRIWEVLALNRVPLLIALSYLWVSFRTFLAKLKHVTMNERKKERREE